MGAIKPALRAVAQVVGVDTKQAAKVIRRQPLFDEEIPLEEELINLEETIKSYHVAFATLKNYPAMRQHAKKERRLIMMHCIGLVSRMLKGLKLPREYTAKDIEFAVHKLVSLLVDDAQSVGYKIDDSLLKCMRPYMSWRQQLSTAKPGTRLDLFFRLTMQKLL